MVNGQLVLHRTNIMDGTDALCRTYRQRSKAWHPKATATSPTSIVLATYPVKYGTSAITAVKSTRLGQRHMLLNHVEAFQALTTTMCVGELSALPCTAG
jgi:hypothetical protein